MKTLFLTIFSLLFITTLSAQSSWQYLPTAPSNGGRIDDVFFLNPQLGWSASADGAIFKTTDAGQHWEKVYQTNSYFRCIEFLDENIGYAGTLNAKFLRTTDGGYTWTNLAPYISPVPPSVCGISIVDSLYAYAVGEWDSPGFVLKTTDGGLHWTSQKMTLQAIALVDVFFMSRDTGFVTGQGPNGRAVILYTTNGGQTWEKKFESSSIGHYVWKIQRVTNDFWVASIQTYNGGRFAKSFDGGQTWTEYTAPVPDMQGIGFSTPLHGWVGGYVSGFYETEDGGDTWAFKNFGGNFNRFYFLDSTLAFASGNSIYKYSPTGASSTFQPDQPGLQVAKLDMMYSPNPVQSFMDISFTLLKPDNLRINIYSIDGTLRKEIYHERFLSPGEYRFRADCSGLPAGAYFLGIQRNCGLEAKLFSKL